MVNLIIGFFLGVFGCAAGCLMRLAMEGRRQSQPHMLTKEEREKQERVQDQWNNLMNYTGPQK